MQRLPLYVNVHSHRVLGSHIILHRRLVRDHPTVDLPAIEAAHFDPEVVHSQLLEGLWQTAVIDEYHLYGGANECAQLKSLRERDHGDCPAEFVGEVHVRLFDVRWEVPEDQCAYRGALSHLRISNVEISEVSREVFRHTLWFKNDILENEILQCVGEPLCLNAPHPGGRLDGPENQRCDLKVCALDPSPRAAVLDNSLCAEKVVVDVSVEVCGHIVAVEEGVLHARVLHKGHIHVVLGLAGGISGGKACDERG